METSATTPRQLAELKPKMRLVGRVTKTEMFGAFVDVGLDQPGMVHISMLRREPVNKVEDVVHQGQEVEVWVHRVDVHSGRLELTMIRPLQLEWKDLKSGVRARGKVVRMEKFGAFVDIGAERPGLVHVSEMSRDYVGDPTDVVKVGDEVDVLVLEVDRKKHQIRLSMKAADIAALTEEDEETEVPSPTPMELALRQAMEQAEKTTQATQASPAPSGRRRKTQEDILTRTLQSRVRSSTEQ